MSHTVEKVWKHKSNTCVVLMTDVGHRCGYVGIKPGHPLYEEDYDSRPEIIQDSCESLIDSPIGKRGVINIILFDPEEGIRVVDLFDVHGSLTYSGGKSTYPITSWIELRWPSRSNATFYYNPWWFGYDCAHAGDGKDLSVVSDIVREISEIYSTHGILRSLDYCISECESLSDQLEDLL